MIKLLKDNYLLVKGKQTLHIGNYHLNQKQKSKNTSSSHPFHSPPSNFVRYAVMSLSTYQTYYLILPVLLSDFLIYVLLSWFYSFLLCLLCTRRLHQISKYFISKYFFDWCNLCPIKRFYSNSVLKFLFLKRYNFQQIKLQLRWQIFPEISSSFPLAYSKI